ncbi:replication initiation factor domain-containing protein [Nitrospira japonica]|nr:replication initiation factor domain-containing protein [Nitrospira japonica]
MKALLNVKELASVLGVSVKSVQRAYRRREIPVHWLCRMALFDLDEVRRAMALNGSRRFDTSVGSHDKDGAAGGASRRRQPAARRVPKPPDGKTGAQFPEEDTEETMSWTCSLGWLRFTVPNASVEETMRLVGGDWVPDEKGFLGYGRGWMCRGSAGGLGRIGSGAKRAPLEVHVDLSQELLSGWTYDQFQAVAQWVFMKQGHFGRIDVALDDRSGVIDVEAVYDAVVAGQCVSHFRKSQLIEGLDVGSGEETGTTLCMGSRQSDTYLRIYDKAAQQQSKGIVVEGPWVRWEMEWKDERAQAVGLALSVLDQDRFQPYIVGVFRTAVDFRDCTREDDPKDRYHAPLLAWWKVLTEGMQRAKLDVVKAVKKIEDVKQWAAKSLAPMLGLLCVHPEAGERWLVSTIIEGVERWRPKHYAFLASGQDVQQVLKKVRWWKPTDGFAAGCASTAP